MFQLKEIEPDYRTVTVSASPFGKVSVDKNTVAKDAADRTVTVTVTKSAQWEIADVMYRPRTGGTAQKAVSAGSGKYTFTMPFADVIVYATFVTPAEYDAVGTGTAEDPYVIYSVPQIEDLAENVNDGKEDGDGDVTGKYFVLGNDISDPVSGGLRTPIGNAEHPFDGIFDGRGYTVQIMHQVQQDNPEAPTTLGGLFGYNTGTVRNVLVSGNVSTWTYWNQYMGIPEYGDEWLGCVCGYNKGTIENCASLASIQNGNFFEKAHLGSIVGGNEGGTVKNCYFYDRTGQLSACGSIIGEGSTITNCYYDSGMTDVAEANGVTGLATAKMKAAADTDGALVDLLNGYKESDAYPERFIAWDVNAAKNAGYPYMLNVPAHTHTFTYGKDESGSKLTATCTCVAEEGVACTLIGEVLTLTLTKDGFTDAAETAAWTGAKLMLPTVNYYKSGETTSLGTTKPTEAGSYVAKAKIGSVTVQVSFEVLGHTHDGVTFKPWTETTSLPTKAGNWYLTGDVTLSGTWNVPAGTKQSPKTTNLELVEMPSNYSKINITQPDGGVITTDKQYAPKGSKVSLIVVPDDGNVLKTLNINGTDVAPLPEAQPDGTYIYEYTIPEDAPNSIPVTGEFEKGPPVIRVSEKPDAPQIIYGTPVEEEPIFTVKPLNLPDDVGGEPVLTVQWEKKNEDGTTEWVDESPKDVTVTPDGKVTTTEETQPGNYIFHIVCGEPSGPVIVVSAPVALTVEKITPKITTNPTADEITYGDTLEDSELKNGAAQKSDTDTTALPGTFVWDDVTIAPAVSDSSNTEYDVIFTPEDTAHYKTVPCKVKVTVNKADYKAVKTVSANLKAKSGSSVEITLPTIPDGTGYGFPQKSNSNDKYTLSSISGGKITATSTGIAEGTADMTFTVYVMPDNNHNGYYITVTLKPMFKTEVTITGLTKSDAVYDGNSHKGVSGTAVCTAESTNVTSECGTLVYTYYKETATPGSYETTGTITAPTDAGNYKVVVSVPEENETYEGSTELTFTIAKKEIEVIWANTTPTYDPAAAAPQIPTASYTGIGSEGGMLSVTTTATDTKAGTYTATAAFTDSDTYKNNYVLKSPATKEYTVSPKTLTTPAITVQQDNIPYTGDEIKPAVELKDGTNVIPAAEYTVSYQNNVNAGTATIIITDKTGGNYTVSGSTTFTIVKATPTLSDLSATPITYGETLADSTVTGTAKNADKTVEGSFAFTNGTTVPAVSDSNATDYGVTFTPADTANFNTATGSTKITVNKQSVTPPPILPKAYTGGTLTADVPASEKYTVKTNNGGTGAGEYSVVLTIGPNYKWEGSDDPDTTVTFTIIPAAQDAPEKGEGYTVGDGTLTPDSGYAILIGGEGAPQSGNPTTSPVPVTPGQTYAVRKSGKTNYDPSAYTPIDTTVTVNVLTNSEDMGTVSVEGTEDGRCSIGDIVTVKAEPKDGYRFVEWRDAAGIKRSETRAYPFPVKKGETLTAVFAYDAPAEKTVVEIPTVTNVEFDNTEKTAVAENDDYIISGDNKATDAGTYTVTVTLDGDDKVWTDGTTEPKPLVWNIFKAPQTKPEVTVTEKKITVTDGGENIEYAPQGSDEYTVIGDDTAIASPL